MEKNFYKSLILSAILLCLGLSITAKSQIPELLSGWPFKTNSGFVAFLCTPATTADSTNCGDMAVYFADNLSKIYKFQSDGTNFLNWPFVNEDTTYFNISNPIVVDIDHDGFNEVLKIGTIYSDGLSPIDYQYRALFLIDHDGALMPGWPWIYTARIGGINVADFNDDGEYEIMATVPSSGLLFSFNRYGNIIDGWPIELPSDVQEALPRSYCVGDLDLDGTCELIIAGLNHIYGFNHDGTMHTGFPINIPDTSYHYCYSGAQPALADIDHDGYLEIIASSSQWHPGMIFNSEIYIYEHTGVIKDPWPLSLSGLYVYQNPIPVDIDGDSDIEIGFQAGTQFYFLDINKNPKPGWPRVFYGPDGEIRSSNSDFIIADLNGDDHCEIFTDYNVLYPDSLGPDSIWYYGHSWLFGVDYQGNELPGYPIRVNGAYLGLPPQFGYDEINHRLYMAIATEMLWFGLMDTVSLELFLFPDSTGPADQWPMLSHDLLMTRNYNFVDNAASDIRENPEAVPNSFCVRQNYPNPFNSSTVIRYDLPDQATVTIKIYNILGQVIATLADGIQPAGRHSVIWNADNSPSGVYFCQIQTGEYLVTRKMMLIK